MNRTPFLLPTALILGISLFLSADRLSGEENDRQKAAVMEKEVKVSLDYLLYLPKGYEEKESWPLVLFLHGKGERGHNLELIKKNGLPKLIATGKEFPFIVVSPQCPDGEWWEPFALKTLLDDVVEKYKVDKDRIYVTGLSMGGFGTWALAAYQPHRFAAIVPICGGGEPFLTQFYSHLPVWAFHGAKDPVVPAQRTAEMVEALKKNDGNVRFTLYRDAVHDCWTETYENPELYEWLLEQKRTREEK